MRQLDQIVAAVRAKRSILVRYPVGAGVLGAVGDALITAKLGVTIHDASTMDLMDWGRLAQQEGESVALIHAVEHGLQHIPQLLELKKRRPVLGMSHYGIAGGGIEEVFPVQLVFPTNHRHAN